MSQDVSTYWLPATLTPMGLLQYWTDEVQLYATSHPSIDLEFGSESGTKGLYQHGDVIVTTHRIVWMAGATGGKPATPAASSASSTQQQRTCIYLPLECLERVETKSGPVLTFGLFSTPKVVLYLHDPGTMAYLKAMHARAKNPALAASSPAPVAPPKSTLQRSCKVAFRGEAYPQPFVAAIQSAAQAGVFRNDPPAGSPVSGALNSSPSASSPPSAGPGGAMESSFRTAGAGIGGIVREAKVRERAVDAALELAFGDLSALMNNAKTIVDLAAKLRASDSRELDSDPARKSFDQAMENMGILNPVTQSMTGSAFHSQLAREIADFLPPFVQREGGMMLLTDAYCRINRARGTQLISPQDCLTAAQLLATLNAPLRLQEHGAGVKVLVADGAVQQVGERLKKELIEQRDQLAAKAKAAASSFDPYRDAPSLSPLELSDRWHISIILAKQYLQVAEQQQILCRDESIHGLTFYMNQF